ncbi:MAG TPA: alpha/beta fold hydrolase [Opitutaceae bacterium]
MKKRAFAFVAFLTASAALAAAAQPLGEAVVLLHGLGRGRLAMKRLERTLRAAGYEVHNVGYDSQRHDIAALADQTLAPFFAASASRSPAARVHIVTHSLGGILVRQYLHTHGMPPALGRVVMLAPPNQGCEIVDRLRGWRLYRWLNGPAGVQLGTDAASVPNTLGPLPAGAEVGVIAGDFSWNPLTSSWIDGQDDGKVSVKRTHVAGERDHRVVHASHTWIMWRRATLDHMLAFLRTGRFGP